jgi:pimeloyl-ACP methyl ester carboxylesterase
MHIHVRPATQQVERPAYAWIGRARSHIPGAEAKIVPEVGHLLGMQRPDLVNEWILAFLDARSEACRAANDDAAR